MRKGHLVLFVAAALWVAIACDGRLHWDEPAYWYTAAYLSVPQILAGDFQPSGIEGFSDSRLGHILMLKGLVAVAGGPGPLALLLIIATCLALLGGFLYLTLQILRTLDPAAPHPRIAVALVAFTPVILYLGFKTLAEIPALFLATLATFAFLRSLAGRPAAWLPVAAAGLALVGFVKNHIAIVFVALLLALLLLPPLAFPRRRVLAQAMICCFAAAALFLALLWVTQIPVSRYFAVLSFVDQRQAPVTARVLAVMLECGTFLLALPFAALNPRRREVAFFALWFALTTLPLLFLGWVEDRYLAANIPPLAGLVQLAIETRAPRWGWLRFTGVALVLIVPSALAQFISLHDVRMDQMHAALRRLDSVYGKSYTLLTAREYQDFHYLRFVYPQRRVFDVYTPQRTEHLRRQPWPPFQRRFYRERAIHTVDQLRALPEPLLYFGIETNLTVQNLRRLARVTPLPAIQRLTERGIAGLRPRAYLEESWISRDPRVRFGERIQTGPYVAIRVSIAP